MNKSITCIINDANCRLTSSKHILQEARSFYHKLYSTWNIDDNADLKSIFAAASKSILSDCVRDSIEGPVTHDELVMY